VKRWEPAGISGRRCFHTTIPLTRAAERECARLRSHHPEAAGSILPPLLESPGNGAFPFSDARTLGRTLPNFCPVANASWVAAGDSEARTCSAAVDPSVATAPKRSGTKCRYVSCRHLGKR
jgi:hypothetical protein